LWGNPNINIDFIEKYYDKLEEKHWYGLCLYNNIPISFFEEHLDKIKWYHMSCNNFKLYLDSIEINENKNNLGKARKKLTSFNQLYFLEILLSKKEKMYALIRKLGPFG